MDNKKEFLYSNTVPNIVKYAHYEHIRAIEVLEYYDDIQYNEICLEIELVNKYVEQ